MGFEIVPLGGSEITDLKNGNIPLNPERDEITRDIKPKTFCFRSADLPSVAG